MAASILAEVDLEDVHIIEIIEDKIRQEILQSDIDYGTSRDVFWKPISQAILARMRSNSDLARKFIVIIDKTIHKTKAYEVSNLPMEMLLEAVISRNPFFNFERYKTPAYIYSIGDKRIEKPSSASVAYVILGGIEDAIEEKTTVRSTLEMMQTEEDPIAREFSLPQTLGGIGQLMANKHFPIVDFDGLKEQIKQILNITFRNATDFEHVALQSNAIINVVHTGYNLVSPRSLVKYMPDRQALVEQEANLTLTMETIEHTRVLEVPDEDFELEQLAGPIDIYDCPDAERKLVIFDYEHGENRYMLMGHKDEDRWDPLLPLTTTYEIAPEEGLEMWMVAANAINIMKHLNFINPLIVEPPLEEVEYVPPMLLYQVVELFPTYDPEEDYEALCTFMRTQMDFDSMNTIRKAKFNVMLHKLKEVIYRNISDEIQPFSSLSASATFVMEMDVEFAGVSRR